MKLIMYLIFSITLFKNAYAEEYREKIQPIFDNRCIACHSCLNGPCQLNLQNYENFERGAHHRNVYEGTRINSTPPTRPGIDGKSITDWRKLGFFDVNQTRQLDQNLFFQMLGIKTITQRDIPFNTVEESVSCVDNIDSLSTIFSQRMDLKMPYALQPLTKEQRDTMGAWLAKGAPGPEKLTMPLKTIPQVRLWESFLNQQSAKEQLVSRYLFEHIFLAHIYFPEAPETFFRLVRSKNKCEEGIDEINTRRPNDNPGDKDFYYCLKFLDSSIVAKTHMPFEFTPKVMKRIKDLFFGEKWEVTKASKNRDNYSQLISENPFAAFIDIPVKARYQFLLDNSHFIISTFIKGPVCNGSNALNSIQEQFYVMFLSPDSDTMVKSKAFEQKAKDLLILPGLYGSDVKLASTLPLTKKIVEHREGYRKLRAEEIKKNYPKGYALKDLWNGEGENENALLTVFRHNDNSVVMKGWQGDVPKTLFFLDYALLERLVYNLVVNFDVYGNVSHQTLTRVYMDLLRMEAEEIFLSFLPPESRDSLRSSWYKGLLTEAKMRYLFPIVDAKLPTLVTYANKNNLKKDFIEKILFNYVTPKVRGPLDLINWKQIVIPDTLKIESPLTEAGKTLRELASMQAKKTLRFPNFFPEDSYIVVTREQAEPEIYTVIKNREHENISWILAESLRLAPDEDSLTFVKGFQSFYPVQFFVVSEKKLWDFKNKAMKIKTQTDYDEFKKDFAVSRVSNNFWEVYDLLNLAYKKQSPIEAGYLDLTRYVME